MREHKFILNGKVPEATTNLLKWARWMETANRHVRQDQIGPLRISTVFLGIDHSFGKGPPILFETAVFDGNHNPYRVHYSTWDQAEAGHQRAVVYAKRIVARAEDSSTSLIARIKAKLEA